LRLAGGSGCARLLRADVPRGALLLERLGRSLHELALPLGRRQGDPRERAHRLAARCGLDATAIWQWGVAERVATGLLLSKIELQPVGRQMLAAADHVAE
jgi:hypothetical protein